MQNVESQKLTAQEREIHEVNPELYATHGWQEDLCPRCFQNVIPDQFGRCPNCQMCLKCEI